MSADTEEIGRLCLLRSAIHVPLSLWVPGCPPVSIDRPVSLSQVGPTLAELAGLELAGRSLFPGGPDLPVVAEVVQVLDLFKRAVIGQRYKLIVDVRNGGRALFDLVQDPSETTNLYAAAPELAAALEERYQAWLDHPGAEL